MTRISIVAVAMLAVFATAACREPTTSLEECSVTSSDTCPPTERPDAAAAKARARWIASRPVSYDYTLAVSRFCGPDVTRRVVVSVTGATVTSSMHADDGTPVSAQWATVFPSIGGLFDLLADARRQNAARADATFDTTLGYPLQIALDYRAMIADDEYFDTISSFRVR